VQEGENLSPFLFSLLNDLQFYFIENNVSELQEISKSCMKNIGLYVKLFLMLYADDMVILSGIPEGLQKSINIIEIYQCNT